MHSCEEVYAVLTSIDSCDGGDIKPYAWMLGEGNVVLRPSDPCLKVFVCFAF